MVSRSTTDRIDRIILATLSLYESLTSLELWYEIGENHAVAEAVTKEEISQRLDALRTQGLVERLTGAGGTMRWAVKRGTAER